MTDDVYDWPTERARAIRLFGGDAPGPTLEQNIIDVFATHPEAVAKAIDRVAQRWAQGTVTSPWAVLRLEVQKAVTPAAFVQATNNTQRAVAEARAEQWMRAAGLHYDRWHEVEDDLFGDRGRLHPWHSDDQLKQRMEHLWNEVRPAGEALEHDQLERADRWKQQRTPAPTKEPVAA